MIYLKTTQYAVNALIYLAGAPVDGYVGPLTKMVLYNEKQGLKIPNLD